MANQIDINSISYDVRLIDQNGNFFPLNNAITSLQLEELEDELAALARISFAVPDVGNNNLISLIKLNCPIVIYGKWNTAAKKLFTGNVWDWGYSHSSRKILSITACDPLIRLQQCQDFKYYSAGLTTQYIISDICKSWNIPLVYSFQSITHGKQIFDGIAVSDMITSLLNEVKQKTGYKFIVSYRDGAMRITGYGTNSIIYKFDRNVTISTSDNLSMHNLVTRVKILGTADDSGRSPVEAVLDGDTSFGILQSILKREHDETLADANSEAQNIINENGTPQETISVSVPDLPFLHKGDAIQMNAANLIGTLFVTGVSHNSSNKTMSLQLSRSSSVNLVTSFTSSQLNADNNSSSTVPSLTDLSVGLIVFFNGGVCASSPIPSSYDLYPNSSSGFVKILGFAPAAPYPLRVIGGAFDRSVQCGCDAYGWVRLSSIRLISS